MSTRHSSTVTQVKNFKLKNNRIGVTLRIRHINWKEFFNSIATGKCSLKVKIISFPVHNARLILSEEQTKDEISLQYSTVRVQLYLDGLITMLQTYERCCNMYKMGWFGVVRGHGNVTIDRAHTTSYSSLIETIRLSCTVFEIWRVICRNSSTLPHSPACMWPGIKAELEGSAGWTRCSYDQGRIVWRKQENVWGYARKPGEKKNSQ